MERSPFAETPEIVNKSQSSKITKKKMKNEKSEHLRYHCVRTFLWVEAGIGEFESYEDSKSQKVQVSNKNPSLFDVKIGTILDDFQTMSVMPMHCHYIYGMIDAWDCSLFFIVKLEERKKGQTVKKIRQNMCDNKSGIFPSYLRSWWSSGLIITPKCGIWRHFACQNEGRLGNKTYNRWFKKCLDHIVHPLA